MKRMKMFGMILATMMLVTLPANAVKKQKQPTPQELAADSLAKLTERADPKGKNDDKAQNTLGVWYYTGKNVKQDFERALGYWALAAKQNNPDAIGNMAMCFQQGKGIQKDSLKAAELYKKAIGKGNTSILKQLTELADKQNDLFSCLLLHELYSKGISVKRDQAKGQQYLKKAATIGHANSQLQWALLCLNDKNPKEAVTWFKKAADKGNLSATYYYGYLLFKGMGVTQNKAEGINYLRQASKRGLVAADNILGAIYYEGDGTEKNIDQALKHLKKAAVAKMGDSQFLLGQCYKNGEGVDKDYDLAVQWLAEAYRHQKADDVKGLIGSGTDANFANYIDGLKKLCIDKDFENAAKLFKKVEKAGIIDGLTMQALCLANADNPKKNEKKAFKMLTEAATSNATAKYQLSKCYEEGIGTDKNTDTARDLLLQAAEKGNGNALSAAGDLFFEGKGVAQDYVKAANYYLQAEALSKLTASSAQNLIKCYNMDISSLPDLNKKEERIQALKKIISADNVLTMLKKL